MSANDIAQNLTNLNGNNFSMKKFGVTFLLESHELNEFVDNNTYSNHEEWKNWEKACSKLADIILTSIE